MKIIVSQSAKKKKKIVDSDDDDDGDLTDVRFNTWFLEFLFSLRLFL